MLCHKDSSCVFSNLSSLSLFIWSNANDGNYLTELSMEEIKVNIGSLQKNTLHVPFIGNNSWALLQSVQTDVGFFSRYDYHRCHHRFPLMLLFVIIYFVALKWKGNYLP